MATDITPLELFSLRLKVLKPRTILMLEQALEKMGPRGEIKIVKQDGQIALMEPGEPERAAGGEERGAKAE